MFLKSYTQASDQLLIEQINKNIDYQFFCGIRISPGQKLQDYKIVSHIRCEIAESLNIEEQQAILAEHWVPYMITK